MSAAVQAIPAGHYRLRNVVRSEITKILTLRSTAIMLGLTTAAALLVTGLVARSTMYQPGQLGSGFDPTQSSLTGLIVAGLTGGVFGALLITAEYSSGTIRASLSATPRRVSLLAAKIGVTVVAILAFCEALSFAAFFLGQAVFSSRHVPSATLGTPGALRAVLMTGAFIALLAVMSFGFGLVCRNTAGALAAFVGVVFVLPLVMRAISESAVRFTPVNILVNSVMSTVNLGHGPLAPLAPAAGLGLMAVYAAAAVTAGAVLFVKRDA